MTESPSPEQVAETIKRTSLRLGYKFGTQNKFRITGDDLLNIFYIKKTNNNLHISTDIPDTAGKPTSKGMLWSGTEMHGYVWTPRVEELNGIDMSTEQRISDSPKFDFDAFKNSDDVIHFGNGYGVNLFGGIMDEGKIISAGSNDNYVNNQGKKLIGRVITQRNDGRLDELIIK